MGQREFVAMMAMLMALNALAIDSMLPALPDIARALRAPSANAQQQVVSFYFLGLGLGSLIHGPLADRFGRRSVILASLIGYIVSAAFAGFAPNWTAMLLMRSTHGLFGAAMGVVATSVVRDRTSGDAMARLMSLIFLIFMIVPIIAPSIGQAILWVVDWRWIFLWLAGFGLVMALWVHQRLPETLRPDDVQQIDVSTIARNWWALTTHRLALAYNAGSAIVVGANFGFLNSAQQIIAQTFGRVDIFPLAFASVAGGIAVANYSNSRLVLRFGARRVSHAALMAFIALSGAQWWNAGMGENLSTFLIILSLNMGMIGFIGANFSSMAMEPFGHIAGTASSFQTAMRTFVAAAIGAIIGARFDGSAVPLAQGYMLCGLASLAFVLWGERGRLFTRPSAPHLPVPRA
ncbi:MAG: multidrug effflux MFS transporter [Sphingopyxis sp.]